MLQICRLSHIIVKCPDEEVVNNKANKTTDQLQSDIQ